jgi:CheY-like chemotaxis protein
MFLRSLLVDDNDAFLEAASVLLEREGMMIVGVASNTAAALRQARALRPDVILVDIGLGDESGFDLARLLTRDGQGGQKVRAEVILISSYAETDYAQLIAESRRPDSWRSRSCLRGRSAGSWAARHELPARGQRRDAWSRGGKVA